MKTYIEFDRPKFVRLKRAYEKAKMNKEEVFTFEDKEYPADYVKYLIEYLENSLEGR